MPARRSTGTTRVAMAVMTMLVMACSKSDVPAGSASGSAAAGDQPHGTATGGAAPMSPASCPATGLWAECSALYHLGRAGLVARVDSGRAPDEKNLGGTPLMVKVGANAELELHIYADSAARMAAGKTLNRSDFVDGTAEQTMKRERTLIESANLLGLLTSLNAHQRERVSDALTAGPPQPAQPMPAVKVKSPTKS